MSEYHKVCKDCVLNKDGCLLQQNDDVESCPDVHECECEETE